MHAPYEIRGDRPKCARWSARRHPARGAATFRTGSTRTNPQSNWIACQAAMGKSPEHAKPLAVVEAFDLLISCVLALRVVELEELHPAAAFKGPDGRTPNASFSKTRFGESRRCVFSFAGILVTHPTQPHFARTESPKPSGCRRRKPKAGPARLTLKRQPF